MHNGRIDRCRGRYISGWAFPAIGAGHCKITITDPTGRPLATGIANEERGDLAVLNAGRIDFAFTVSLPAKEKAEYVHVFADAIELLGSPMPCTAETYDGEISVTGGVVSGWVCGRQQRPITATLTLTDQDGDVVLSVKPAPDRDSSDPLFMPARFSAELPARCFGRDEMCLIARIGETEIARTLHPMRLEGYIDKLTGTRCAGWLFSPNAPERVFSIAVYRDGLEVATGKVDVPRDDVVRHFNGPLKSGFEIALPPCDGVGEVSVRLVGSEHDLFGGPFLVGTHAAITQEGYDAIEALYRAGIEPPPLLRQAFGDWVQARRQDTDGFHAPVRKRRGADAPERMTIVVPVYSDVAATRTCLRSVMRTRRVGRDRVVIVNDNPADPAIAELLDTQERLADVFVLRNGVNAGFIASVNRALAFARTGDVLLLNADTELYPGALDELYAVLHASPDIGSVTAMSNNATLFSYPHPSLTTPALDDIGWAELAAVALEQNAGASVTIPTGHGFCMLIRRETLDEVGLLDMTFGRGYGEENDFSVKACDRGWRHVLAGGVLVRHDEAASFGDAKTAMVEKNLAILGQRYPEYHTRVCAFAAEDPVRRLRWPLDFHRLKRFAASGLHLQLVVANWLDGGMKYAATDIEAVVRTDDLHTLRLTGTKEGQVVLQMDGMELHALFQPDEADQLFVQLAQLRLERVVVHHLLGFTAEFVTALRTFMQRREAIFHVHDLYYACPRVTMIDASGEFCDGSNDDRCARCTELAGPHEAYRMTGLSPGEHRELFSVMLTEARHVIAPSRDTANRLAALLPGSHPIAIAHPQIGMQFPKAARTGSDTDICLIGAIGPHKGSATLKALARYARLNHPEFHFHVIGFTDIDEDLRKIGNVTVHGKYDAASLADKVTATGGRIALFLHGWPETFSYTLSEAASLGLIPVVPDIGAPAERVRAAGFGVVYPFPISVEQLIRVLKGIGDRTIGYTTKGGGPRGFASPDTPDLLKAAYTSGPPSNGKARKRKVARSE